MLLVGLTGGIGSGKSTVAALLAEHGAVVVDADRVARDLQQPGAPLLERIAERFGSHVIRPDGSLDRAGLAAIVFGETASSREALADLNAITHPAIGAEITRRIAGLEQRDAIVVLDHPLLAEHPRDDVDVLVVVDVEPEVAIARLVQHRGMSADDARRRIASQMPRRDRLERADFVVDNSGDADQLGDAVDALRSALADIQRGGGCG